MKKNYFSVLLGTILIATLFNACVNSEQKKTKAVSSAFTIEHLRYAREFSIKKYQNYKLLEVKNPWDSLHVLARYILVSRNIKTPQNLPEGIIIRTPVQSIGCTTSVMPAWLISLVFSH